MTKSELKRFMELKREIAEERVRVESLRSDKSLRVAAELDRKIKRLEIQQARIEKFISGIDDPLVRRAMVAKYIEGRSWSGVARKLGGNNTEEGVRKICERWIRRHG